MSVNADEADPNADEADPIPVYKCKANRLEILRMGYDNQLRYLRLMSDLDVKVFTGYITVQLVVANWVARPCGVVQREQQICVGHQLADEHWRVEQDPREHDSS